MTDAQPETIPAMRDRHKAGVRPSLRCPVVVRGKLYESQKAAAKALKVCPSAISQQLNRVGHCDNVGLGLGGAALGNKNAKAREIKIGPYTFRSHLQASIELGVSRSTIARFANGTAKAEGKQLVIRAAMQKFYGGKL